MLAALTRWTRSLADPARRPRAILFALAAYVAVWTLYASVSSLATDLHYDSTELVAWSLDPALGYPKHPPLAAWIVGAWFSVFPRADWAYRLLAGVGLAVALWFVALTAARYLTKEKAAAACVLLTLTPAFNFLALRFNPNALLIPLWAAATYTFLRSYEERTLSWGAAAGVAAALAMLGKYWSVFLLVGFAAAVLVDPRKKDYFRSPAPWASAAAGFLLLAPHLFWMLQSGFSGFDYAVHQHLTPSLTALARAWVNYLVGGLLYMTIPVIAVMVAARPSRETLREMIWPREPARRFLAAIFWAALLAPIPVSFTLGTRLDSLWTLSSWTLLPVLLLAPDRLALSVRGATAIVAAACAYPLIALAASPAVMFALHTRGTQQFGAQTSLIARAADCRWQAMTAEPLRYVAGRQQLAWGATFYGRDRPRALPEFSPALAPWIDAGALRREGWVGLCPVDQPDCVQAACSLAAGSAEARVGVAFVARLLFGIKGETANVLLVLVPPPKNSRGLDGREAARRAASCAADRRAQIRWVELPSCPGARSQRSKE